MAANKLSDAQHRALRVLGEKGHARYSNETLPATGDRMAKVFWMPADKLIGYGYAVREFSPGRDLVHITPAGRAALDVTKVAS